MAIPIRSPGEIDEIALASQTCARILRTVAARCVPGAVTRDLDALAAELMSRAGAAPLFLGYGQTDQRPAFSGAICVSINDELVHGLPGDRLVREGDVVSLDMGLTRNGWCADCATTVLVPPVADAHAALRAAVVEVLRAAHLALAPGARWSEIVNACGAAAHRSRIRLIEPYAGHGVGRSLHEPPRAPLLNTCDGSTLAPHEDFTLRPGMVLTIEPIGVRGSPETVTAPDGWTVLSKHRHVGCHEERMVAIVRGGCRALTASLDHHAASLEMAD